MCQIYSIQVVTHLKLKSQCKYKNREVIAQKRACSEIPYNQDAPPLPTCCSALLEALACIRNKNVHGLLSRATSCRIASLARQVCFFFFFTLPWPVASTGGKTPPRRAWGCTRYWIPLVHLILCMPFLWPIRLCDIFRFGWIWLIAVEKQTRVDWWIYFYGLLWALFREKNKSSNFSEILRETPVVLTEVSQWFFRLFRKMKSTWGMAPATVQDQSNIWKHPLIRY